MEMDQHRFPLSNSVYSSGPPTQGVSIPPPTLLSRSEATPGSSEASSVPGSDSCECTGAALRILESVAVPAEAGDWSATEQGLYSLKRNIWGCYILFARCTTCRQDSRFTILTLILCEKLTGIFEEATAGWEWQLRSSARSCHKSPGWIYSSVREPARDRSLPLCRSAATGITDTAGEV